MIVWEIEARRALASLVTNDSKTVHFPKNHTDTGTACVLVRRISAGTVHVRMDTMTEDRIRRGTATP